MMAILAAIVATIIAGLASIFLYTVVESKIDDAFRARLTDKQPRYVSAIVGSPLVGSPIYTMVIFGMLPLGVAAVIHLAHVCILLAIILIIEPCYFEGFVLLTIICVLSSILIPAVPTARELRDDKEASVRTSSITATRGDDQRAT